MLKILLLVALIKLLLTTRKPFLCAGIYTGLWLVLSLIAGTPLLNLLLVGAIGFGWPPSTSGCSSDSKAPSGTGSP